MPKNHESETTIERRAMAPWMKWGAILGVFACAATVVMALPTLGSYAGHVAAVWRAPEQYQRIDVLQSNQVQQSFQIQSMDQNVRETRQDVRDIKIFLYNGNKKLTINLKTNSIYE